MFLFIFTNEALPLTCYITDEHGYSINEAYPGETIYLLVEVNLTQSKKLKFNVSSKFNSLDSNMFSMTSTYKGNIYHEGSTDTAYYWIGVWIPYNSFVTSASFTGKLSKVGDCSATININQSGNNQTPSAKTWTVYPTFPVIGKGFVTLTVTLTTDPINRTIHMSITNPGPYEIYNLPLVNFQFAQGSNLFVVSEENLSFAGYYGTYLMIPIGETRHGYIINIPSWFNFNEGFTFVFGPSQVFYLE
jgi:hypothetical protein